jgi:hypothetical protein
MRKPLETQEKARIVTAPSRPCCGFLSEPVTGLL